MNIQEQLEKIEGEFKEKLKKTVSNGGFLADVPEDYEPLDFDTDTIETFLHTSALKLLKTAYEEERDFIESEKGKLTMKWDADKHQSWAYDKTITHLNTKIAEVNELMK